MATQKEIEKAAREAVATGARLKKCQEAHSEKLTTLERLTAKEAAATPAPEPVKRGRQKKVAEAS